MKVFEVEPGETAEPFVFELRPEPGFHADFVPSSATFTMKRKGRPDVVLSSEPAVIVDVEQLEVRVSLSAAQTEALGERTEWNFVLRVLDTLGREWAVKDDGRGVVKTTRAL